MKSWNNSFKIGAMRGERFRLWPEAKRQVFDFIDAYYNRKRLHSKLGCLSPVAFESQKVV
jgi:putative transposase